MPELAVGYIKLTTDASGIPREINSALRGVDGQAAAAGSSMGSKMSGALGKTLKVGAAAAGAAAFAGIGATLTKGFSRLNAIDQAQGKLRALGNSGEEVDAIMKNALASVKGTAFGLGDAAGLAGTMVAAGVKPGQELEKTLRLVADSAAIAGTDLNDMGMIFGKIVATGKLDGESLAQLMERQIGILPELAKHFGVTTEEVSKMVSEGKVKFEDFAEVMTEKVGGGAVEMGQTVEGAFDNLKAAAGRVGASALKPLFQALPGGFAGITDALDALEPKVAGFVEMLSSKAIENIAPKIQDVAAALKDTAFSEWAPKLREAWEAAKESRILDDTLRILKDMARAGVDVFPAIQQIGVELAKASAAVGIGTWKLFITALQAVTGVMNLLSPVLSTIADIMEAQPGIVIAAVAAFALFKTVPGIMGRVTSALAPVTSRVQAATTSFRGFSDQMSLQTRLAAMQGVQLSRTGAAMAVMRTQASGLGAAMRNAGSSMMSAMGGPAGIAVAGVTMALMVQAQQWQDNKSKAEAYSRASDDLANAQRDLGEALKETRGAMTDETWSSASKTIDAYTEKVAAMADQHHSVGESAKSNLWKYLVPPVGIAETIRDQNSSLQDASEQAMSTADAFKKLGLSNEAAAKQVYGSNEEWATMKARLQGMGEGGQQAAKDLARLRGEWLNMSINARKIAPGVTEMSEAMQVMGDKAASAADKTKALSSALDSMNPARTASEALIKHAETLERVTAATNEAIDRSKGYGNALVSATGDIDPKLENARNLHEAIKDIVDASEAAAAAGKYDAQMQRDNAAALSGLADAYGVEVGRIKELANSLGYDDLNLVMRLSVEDDATQKLGAISMAWNQVENKKSMTLDVETGLITEQTRAKLESMKVTVGKDMKGRVTLTAQTEEARNKLQSFIQQYQSIPPTKDVAVNSPGGQEVLRVLRDMNVEVNSSNKKEIETTAPLAPNVLQALRDIGYEVETRNGKTIIVRANDEDYQKKKVEWTQDVYKNIIAQGIGFGQEVPGTNGRVFRGPGLADNADGGITVDRFADGGLKQIRKPQRADIYRGRGAGTIFAEEETGGEAYIPLASSKRGRSTSILAEVASRFGLGLVAKRADGAVVTAEDLRRLADGEGASQPLTGAPYVWGGINWGDCSSAMAAFARRAVGLPPFGGRFSTSSMGAQLAQMGFQNGSWSNGALGFGWVNGGPGGGHTAGTLPDGTNVEMGGSYGGGMVGGTVGANSGQFTHRMFLPVGADAKIDPYSPYQDNYQGDPNYQPGQNGTSGSQPQGASLSERLGNAASAAVSGQVQSLLGVLGANDSPGFLAAINEYESQRSQSRQSQPSTTTAPASPTPDPGTTKPKEGEDTGQTEAPTGLDAIKIAFKEGLRMLWRTGPEWDATDHIVTKESSWKPDARNGKYWGLIQAGAEVYEAAGVDPKTIDPTEQARAFDKYVDGRYDLPTKAKAFHDANNWYDQGGLATRKGLMLKGVNTPERVLSPRQTSAFEQMVKREFQSGVGTDEVLARLDRMIALLESEDRGGDTFNWNSSGNSKQDMDEVKRARRVAKLAGV